MSMVKKEVRTLSIFVKNRRTYHKITKFVQYLMHFENVLRLIARWEEATYGTCYITSNPYQLPKLFTGSLCFSKTDSTIHDYIQNSLSVKQSIGGVFTESICHKVAREVKSVIALRTKRKKASLPFPRALTKRNYYTFSIGWFNYSFTRLKKSNKLTIRLGSQRSKFATAFDIRIPKDFVPRHVAQDGDIKVAPEIKITWIRDVGVIVNLAYEHEYEVVSELNKNNFISIDLGYKNFLSIASNVLPSLVISGKPLSSFLYWCSKKAAKLQSNNQQTRHLYLYQKRITRRFNNYVVNQLLSLCQQHNIGTIIVGDICSIYQSRSKGKFNQSFRKVPFGHFIRQLENKAKLFGIRVIKQEESYTSQTCCLDHTLPAKRSKGIIRIRKLKKSFHADINAAWNIAQKAYVNITSFIHKHVSFVIQSLTNPIKIKNYNPLSPEFGLNRLISGRIKRISEAYVH